jgi:glutamate-1-semialdehyde 2,1-aminomutase
VQTTRLDEQSVVEHYKSKTPTSAQIFQKATRLTPGGVSAGIKYFEPYPVFMKRAKGSRVWDVDDNEYVDYLMSYGALILGHGPKQVKQAIQSVLDTVGTTVTGTPTEIELEYGAMLREIFHRDGLLRFTNSGLEATLLAVRLARAATGRKKIAKFEGHYHGAVDQLLFSYAPDIKSAGEASSPVPIADTIDLDEERLARSLVLPFNDWEATHDIIVRNSRTLAGIIMEPFEEGVIPASPSFITNLRKLTRDLKIPLIFDEVKTAFRVRVGGASEFYGITPDITCLGKIIGGGLPIGAVVGDAEVMAQLDPRVEKGRRVFHSGTFNGNPLSLGVGMATVEELMRKDNFESIKKKTDTLKSLMSHELLGRRVAHTIAGEGGMFNLYFADREMRNYRDTKGSDQKFRRILDLELISKGIYLKPGNRYCLSLAHTDADVQLTRERFSGALDTILQSNSSATHQSDNAPRN